MASGRLRAGVGITQGLSVLNSTQEGDPLASRIGADGQFTSFNAWANWTGDLFGPFSARLAAAGQLTSSPVLAINQIRSEEHTSELQSLMRISYAVFCLKKKKK